jgi:hypothetical protein
VVAELSTKSSLARDGDLKHLKNQTTTQTPTATRQHQPSLEESVNRIQPIDLKLTLVSLLAVRI